MVTQRVVILGLVIVVVEEIVIVIVPIILTETVGVVKRLGSRTYA